MISDDDTSTGTPKMPSSVMNKSTDELADVEAAMGPRLRQIRAEIGIGHERQCHDRNDPAGGAPRRLEQQHDERHAERVVLELRRRGGAIGEILAALDGVDQDRGADQAKHHVPPADAVAMPRRHWKQQEAQHQHKGDVRVAQRLRRDDREIVERPGAGDRGIEVEHRHHHRDGGDDIAGGAGEAIDEPRRPRSNSSAFFECRFRNARRITREAPECLPLPWFPRRRLLSYGASPGPR